ncbi:intimin [Salmonella enterica subsp. enterica]|nr:intimin [Salmonella enterica subsp. enterica]
MVEITVQQDRKIELIVDNIADTDRSDHSHEASALADGEDGVVMDLLITDSFGDSTDRNGNELVDDAMMPVLYDSNDKKVTLAQTPCTTETPCVFIASRDKEAGTVTLSSSLPGTFRWKAKADAYGDSNYVDVTFIGDNLSALNAVIYQSKPPTPSISLVKKINILRLITLPFPAVARQKIKTAYSRCPSSSRKKRWRCTTTSGSLPDRVQTDIPARWPTP